MVMYGFWWVRKEGCRCDGMSERDVRNVLIALGARYVRVRVSSDDTLVDASNSVKGLRHKSGFTCRLHEFRYLQIHFRK
jgi:hypothetical protein